MLTGQSVLIHSILSSVWLSSTTFQHQMDTWNTTMDLSHCRLLQMQQMAAGTIRMERHISQSLVRPAQRIEQLLCQKSLVERHLMMAAFRSTIQHGQHQLQILFQVRDMIGIIGHQSRQKLRMTQRKTGDLS